MYRPLAVGLQELVWRKGDERCERSYQKEQAPQTSAGKQGALVKEEPLIQRVAEPIDTEGFRQVSSKREEANAKINSRYLVGSATQNPFMPSNNYVNDIEVQLSYLTPQKS
jgi:hypothetical protein